MIQREEERVCWQEGAQQTARLAERRSQCSCPCVVRDFNAGHQLLLPPAN